MASLFKITLSPIYRRAVKREAAFWSSWNEADTWQPLPLKRIINKACSGKAATDLFSHLSSQGPYSHGLSIGCGGAERELQLLRSGVVRRWTFIDISASALGQLKARVPKRLRASITTMVADLNFLSLKPESYDLIFVENVLHHIINLEHLLFELNISLTTRGVVYVDDFIGPDRFQFSDAQLAAMNAAATDVGKKYGLATKRAARTSRKSLINSCPFEAIRSSAIKPLLEKIFRQKRVTLFGSLTKWATVFLDLTGRTPASKRKIEQAYAYLLAEERRHTLPALHLIGWYAKNPKPPRLTVRLWSAQELRYHLPVSLVNERALVLLSKRLRCMLPRGLHGFLQRSYHKLRG